MLKPGVAVIPIPDSIAARMSVIIGSRANISNEPVQIFDSSRVNFLADLSRHLLSDSRTRSMPDVASFAYWCRQANLKRLKDHYAAVDQFRIGLGLTFHICPANVPVNFAFSMAFGLLSGNICAIRLPSRDSNATSVIVNAVSMLITKKEHANLHNAFTLMRFDRDDELNRFWLSVADGRVVWGGDATISTMRAYPCKPRSREIAFSDRYSLCTLAPDALLQMGEEAFQRFCKDLFNDIYLMDQAACASPQLLAWIGPENRVEKAKARLWPALVMHAQSRYKLLSVQVMDKFVQVCRHAIENNQAKHIYRHNNLLYRVELDGVRSDQDRVRGYFGTIHEVILPSLESLAPIINERYQTLTLLGIDKNEIRNMISSHRLRGIDRVVPVGRALDMDIVWDGYDIVGSLSRLITI
jgi:Acyl-CoA reductase (LuxC)